MGRSSIDLTGQQFHYLTVIERVDTTADGHAQWRCKCQCGNEILVGSNSLRKGTTKSCGCWNKLVATQKAKENYHNLTNKRYGRLIAKEYLGSNGKGDSLWRCECDCGNTNFVTTSHHLVSGNTQSCGCLRSKGESIIQQILDKANIHYNRQHTFPDLIYTSGVPVRFDFYLPDYNRLIEFDGIQHYYANGGWSSDSNLEIVQQRDKIRNEYAFSNNISLVRIPYWERDKITLEMLLGDEYLVKQ